MCLFDSMDKKCSEITSTKPEMRDFLILDLRFKLDWIDFTNLFKEIRDMDFFSFTRFHKYFF